MIEYGVLRVWRVSLCFPAVPCQCCRWKAGARAEVGRQRDQSGQGSRRQQTHSGQWPGPMVPPSAGSPPLPGCTISRSNSLCRRWPSETLFPLVITKRCSKRGKKNKQKKKPTPIAPRTSRQDKPSAGCCSFSTSMTVATTVDVADDRSCLQQRGKKNPLFSFCFVFSLQFTIFVFLFDYFCARCLQTGKTNTCNCWKHTCWWNKRSFGQSKLVSSFYHWTLKM